MAIMLSKRTLFVSVLLFIVPSNGKAKPPKFGPPIVNITVPVGRDAMFGCNVDHLGGYRVGWVKADTKAIQAIHNSVITHNQRVSISHINHATWNLHIRGVQEEDGGVYMCQINTDPMQSQIGILKVVVSPDFIQEETSGDEIIREGTHLFLTCKASGRPAPRIEWRREDGSDIIIRNGSTRVKVPTYVGSTLNMTKILRSEMGAYMCIASNGVPPAVSKRIQVSVTFPPVINVRNQLVGAPLGTSVTLECTVEAFPKPIYYWMAKPDHMLLSNDRLDIGEQEISSFETRMYITVKNFIRRDVGSYRCISKNSLGLVESSVRLYEITGPTLVSRFADEDDDSEYFGSAENEAEEQLTNSVAGRGRSPSLQRTLKAPRATRNTYTDKQVPSEGGTPSCITITVIVAIFSLLILNVFLI
ncbi:hypothetical protein RI129_012048 [Pyrocoelia pectoralis]|uniref:Ig-like domain-containing protein n=1 Tax=Pyrocoelia pectoralis TaxID=417401 RepID=A0AAN7V6X2_9COLE